MPYLTAAEFETALGENRYASIADRNADGTIDSAAVDAALEKASSFADSYLSRFLPIASPYPPSLVLAVIDIAVFDLVGDAATDVEHTKRDNAVSWLKDVARGLASLGVADGSASLEDDDDFLIDAPSAAWTRSRAGGVL